jgi:hypothetical protein
MSSISRSGYLRLRVEPWWFGPVSHQWMCYVAILVKMLACGPVACPVLAIHTALGLERVHLSVMVCCNGAWASLFSSRYCPLHADLMILFIALCPALFPSFQYCTQKRGKVWLIWWCHMDVVWTDQVMVWTSWLHRTCCPHARAARAVGRA